MEEIGKGMSEYFSAMESTWMKRERKEKRRKIKRNANNKDKIKLHF